MTVKTVEKARTMTVKERAKLLVDKLPDDATWRDLRYEIYVMEEIEAGTKDLDEGRVVSQEEVERLYPGP